MSDSSTFSNTATPWFGISLGLMGIIVGYSVGVMSHTGLTAQLVQGDQVASVPAAPAPPAPPAGNPPETGVGPTLGSTDAKVTVVEFTDFQCPFCSRHFTDTFSQIKKDYIDTGKIKYELRNFPLTSIHPNAMKAAQAALCAEKQNKFWEMHDKLFTNQNAWSNQADPSASFKQFAGAIGLNATTFATCLDKEETKDAVNKDMADGSASGIEGTPGFWILGPDDKKEQISGAYPFATFQATIDGMLN